MYYVKKPLTHKTNNQQKNRNWKFIR